MVITDGVGNHRRDRQPEEAWEAIYDECLQCIQSEVRFFWAPNGFIDGEEIANGQMEYRIFDDLSADEDTSKTDGVDLELGEHPGGQ